MSRWNNQTKAALLFVLPLLIYGFGIGREFVFDDVVYIAQNPLLRRSDALRLFWFSSEAFNYYPLFWSILRIEWLLWGDNPLGYHAVTLLVHCVNAVLVWRVARAWQIRGAWWIAALFAVHPINVQTVAWAAEQKNTWSFFFMAAATLAFIKHVAVRRWQSYAMSLVCFIAALGCKTSTVCLPVFLALCYALPWRRQRSSLVLLRLVPFLLTGVAAGVTTMWFERNRAGAQSLIATLSLWQRMEAAGAGFWFYLEKALIPLHLTPMYQGWVDTTAANHGFIPGLLLVAVLFGTALGWRRCGGTIVLGLSYYVLMLLPLLGIFDTNYFAYSQIADHWQYHALPGLLVALVAGGRTIAQRWLPVLAESKVAPAVAVAIMAILASAHFAHFENARSLWSYVVEQNPDAWIGWYNLGNDHADKHEYADAIVAYREAIRVKPDYYRAHFNLANALAASNQIADADRTFLEARKLRPDDPDGYINRGVLLLHMNREEDAIAEFEHALVIDSGKTSAEVNLVAIFLRRGLIEQATAHLQSSAVVTGNNGRRIADAINASAQTNACSSEMLKRFAARACALSGNDDNLLAAFRGLSNL